MADPWGGAWGSAWLDAWLVEAAAASTNGVNYCIDDPIIRIDNATIRIDDAYIQVSPVVTSIVGRAALTRVTGGRAAPLTRVVGGRVGITTS